MGCPPASWRASVFVGECPKWEHLLRGSVGLLGRRAAPLLKRGPRSTGRAGLWGDAGQHRSLGGQGKTEPPAWTCWGHLCNKERVPVLTKERRRWTSCIMGPAPVHVHNNEQFSPASPGTALLCPSGQRAGQLCAWWWPSPCVSLTLWPRGVVRRGSSRLREFTD